MVKFSVFFLDNVPGTPSCFYFTLILERQLCWVHNSGLMVIFSYTLKIFSESINLSCCHHLIIVSLQIIYLFSLTAFKIFASSALWCLYNMSRCGFLFLLFLTYLMYAVFLLFMDSCLSSVLEICSHYQLFKYSFSFLKRIFYF